MAFEKIDHVTSTFVIIKAIGCTIVRCNKQLNITTVRLFMIFNFVFASVIYIYRKSLNTVMMSSGRPIHCVKYLNFTNLLVCNFCGKAQFSHTFGRIAQIYVESEPFHKISAPGNKAKLRYFTQ